LMVLLCEFFLALFFFLGLGFVSCNLCSCALFSFLCNVWALRCDVYCVKD
jgi:hypothetical protein